MALFDSVVYGIAFFALLTRMMDREERMAGGREALNVRS